MDMAYIVVGVRAALLEVTVGYVMYIAGTHDNASTATLSELAGVSLWPQGPKRSSILLSVH